ncbi:MAG: TonB family protein [bacterium]|nr:TonB family protein [bacterium]
MNMRISLSFSTAIHLLFISMLWVWGTTLKPKPHYVPVYNVSLVDLPSGVGFFVPNAAAPQLVEPTVKQIPQINITPKISKEEKIPVIVAKIPEPKISTSFLKESIPGTNVPSVSSAGRESPTIVIGPAGTGLATDGIPFPYPYYLVAVQNKISENWQPPARATASRESKTVVFFQIQRTGRITNIQVEQSSGSIQLDAAAVRAVQLADPLPPLPQGFQSEVLRIHFGFVYYAE